MAVLSAVTAVPLHHCPMDIWTECSVLIQSRRKFRFCLQLLQYCYITMLFLYGKTVVLLVQRKR
jgi:hypothetical protein